MGGNRRTISTVNNEPEKPAKLSVPSWKDCPVIVEAREAFSKQQRQTREQMLAQLERTHGKKTKPNDKP